MIINGGLTERQARALIRIADVGERLSVLERVIEKKLNLEQTEKLVDEVISGRAEEKKRAREREKKLRRIIPAPPRLYMNSINQIIKKIKESNIPCETSAGKNNGYYEYVIKFPISND